MNMHRTIVAACAAVLLLGAAIQNVWAQCCSGVCDRGRYVEFHVAEGQELFLAYDVGPSDANRRGSLNLSMLRHTPNVRDGYWKAVGNVGHFTQAAANEGKLRLGQGKYRVLIVGANFRYTVTLKETVASADTGEEPAKRVMYTDSGVF